MRKPPYFLPRRFLMRLKKNGRNPTNKSGRKGRKSPATPPETATKSSIALKKAVETPADELLDGGRRITLSPATTAAIPPPATSPGAAPPKGVPGSHTAANRTAPATILMGIMT